MLGGNAKASLPSPSESHQIASVYFGFCLFFLGGVSVALCRLHGWELWKSRGTSGSTAEAPGGMWVQSGTRPNKTSQKYNSAYVFLYKFRPNLTLEGARVGLWDHPGTPLAPDPEKPQKDHFSGYLFCVHFWHIVVLFWCLFFDVFCKPLFYQLFVPEAPTGLNFECLWTPFGTHSQQMWKSRNYDSVWEGTNKSSFGGLVFHLVSSCPCANCRDI